MKLRLLDLFSGIGGFSLGLERSGLCETVAFCEIEDFPRRVLVKHWPKVPIYHDVCKLTADTLAQDGIGVDVICGGFPCQDLSSAGKQAGMGEGTRSGLWSECARLVGDIRPKFAIFENVANLLSGPSDRRGAWFSRVLGDLAAIGYDAEWENIPASAMGAPHRRERVWIVAYPIGFGLEALTNEQGIFRKAFEVWNAGRFGEVDSAQVWSGSRPIGAVPVGLVNGLSGRLGEIKAYGNAVVPQIPELIGRAILSALNHNQEYGLAISTRDPRAVTGKHAFAAFNEGEVAPACEQMCGKAKESAHQVFSLSQVAQLCGGFILSTPHDTDLTLHPAASFGGDITGTPFTFPSASFDGLPSANSPGANLAGRGLNNRSQPLFFQSGDKLPNQFASRFSSHFASLPLGVRP